jgi:hypothetical protein
METELTSFGTTTNNKKVNSENKANFSIDDYEKRFLNSLKKLNSPNWLLNKNSQHKSFNEVVFKIKHSTEEFNCANPKSSHGTSNRLNNITNSKSKFNKIKFKYKQTINNDSYNYSYDNKILNDFSECNQDTQELNVKNFFIKRNISKNNICHNYINDKLTYNKNSKSLILLTSDNTGTASKTTSQIVSSANSLSDNDKILNPSKSNENFYRESNLSFNHETSSQLDLKIKRSHSNYINLNKFDNTSNISKSNYSLYRLNKSLGNSSSWLKLNKNSWYKPKDLQLPDNIPGCNNKNEKENQSSKKDILKIGKFFDNFSYLDIK